jgi:hypothetical protein
MQTYIVLVDYNFQHQQARREPPHEVDFLAWMHVRGNEPTRGSAAEGLDLAATTA